MKKIIEIKGMTCGHCQARVEKALGAIEGVTAKVDLKKGQAVVEISGAADDETLTGAVTQAGYGVVSITEKKGFFSR